MDTLYVKTKNFQIQLDSTLSQSQTLKDIEAKTKIPKVYIALGGAFLLFTLIFFNIAAQLLTNVIGWVYPAYMSFQVIEGSNGRKQWLTYWCVFGFLQVVEYFSDALVYWLPFYYLFKTLFALWLMLPQFKGAEVFYVRILRPNLPFLKLKDKEAMNKQN